MGTVKINIDKTAIKHESIHPYTDAGVDRLLRDIYKLANEESYGGDYNSVIIRVDLEHALQSDALTPRQRQAVALYYFCQLTYPECARILGRDVDTKRRINTAIVNVAKHMQGDVCSMSQNISRKYHTHIDPLFDGWMDCVLGNVGCWWDIPDYAFATLNRKLGTPPLDKIGADVSADGYKCYTDKQMERKFAKEVSRPEVYPVFDGYGTQSDNSGATTTLLHKEKYT